MTGLFVYQDSLSLRIVSFEFYSTPSHLTILSDHPSLPRVVLVDGVPR